MKAACPKGTRDFLPETATTRRYVISLLVRMFEAYGFEPLETPAFERIDTLMGKYGDEERLIFKILERGEGGKRGLADLALRYDLTVPLARVLAQYRDIPRPFKRYQIAPVWRAERPQRGRYREFVQCDVDTAGSASPLVEIEQLAMAHDAYQTLGFREFAIQLNHRKILAGLIDVAGVAADKSGAVLVALDKLEKIGRARVLDELTGQGLSQKSLNTVAAIMDIRGSHEEVLGALASRLAGHESALEAVSTLRTILEGLAQSGTPEDRIVLNPVLARGLGYYTCAIFEVRLEQLSVSVGGGGRYDHLIGMFLGKDVPACGFSFGLERILIGMEERGLLPAQRTSCQVLVAMFEESVRSDALGLARELRNAGLNVDLYPDSRKLGTQLKYGSGRGIPFAAIVGPDEIARGEVAVRNLTTREQRAVSRSGLADYLTRALEEAGSVK